MTSGNIDDVVQRIEARSVNVPLRYPIRTSNGTVGSSPLVLIDLTTARGVEGRAYLFVYTPAALAATKAFVKDLGQTIIGQPLAPLNIDRQLSQFLRLLGRTGVAAMAAAGIDMAVWDAFAVAQRAPLAVALGGSIRPVRAYDSHAMDGVEQGRSRAREGVEGGFRAIKTKIGYDTAAEDLEVLRALRDTVGSDVKIMADYNQKLSVADATQRIASLQEEDLYWVEEPTLQEDYAGHAAIRSKSRFPIQMGENWFGCYEMMKAVSIGASDMVMPDVMKIGGVSGWMRAAAIAEQHALPMSNHLFPEISAHLLCVTPTADWLEFMDLAGPILAGRSIVQEGYATAASEPGTGLRWNESAVERYLV